MSKHKSKALYNSEQLNLMGLEDYQKFLKIQSEYGFTQRGGSFPLSLRFHSKKLTSNINLLNYQERKHLIDSELISKN